MTDPEPAAAAPLLPRTITAPCAVFYVRALAIVLCYGALVGVRDVLDWTEDTPLVVVVHGVALFAFDVALGVGLWARAGWAAGAYVPGAIALQIVPYTLFRDTFAATPEHAAGLDDVVVFVAALCAGLVVVLAARR